MQSSITMSKEEKKRKSNHSTKNEVLKYSVGSDISKEKFDSCISCLTNNLEMKIVATRSFNNTPKGIEEYYKWFTSKIKYDVNIVHVVEATGVYYENLSFTLFEKGCKVSVVLPNRAKKYLQGIGVKSKNDKIDSKALSRMGAEQNLELWQAPDENIILLRNLTRHKESLEKTKTSLKNQLSALKSAKYAQQDVLAQQEEIISLIDEKIIETEKLISQLVKNDPVLCEKVKKITKVKGLGTLTVATVIAETNAFSLFKNQRQLVSYSGYDVIENQSGKHVGKTKISKKGNAHIRRIMYMAALSAISSNEGQFSQLYNRVYGRTKIKMKGVVAVQRKLLILIYTLWKNNTEYYSDYQNASGNDEPKLLFSHGFEKTEKNSPGRAKATLNELPCKESPEVLFSHL